VLTINIEIYMLMINVLSVKNQVHYSHDYLSRDLLETLNMPEDRAYVSLLIFLYQYRMISIQLSNAEKRFLNPSESFVRTKSTFFTT
jgi:hypothetical protein